MSECDHDFDKEAYAALADELNDSDAPAWNEDDWDIAYVKAAQRYANANSLSWPPRMGDYDRFYEMEANGELPH